jgi:hypothetical protein
VSHVEFPDLTLEALAAFKAGRAAAVVAVVPIGLDDRRYLAAFLREATKQALAVGSPGHCWLKLKAIADNIHSPPPPPPTLAQARAADLSTPEGQAVARASLATLGEGGP